MNVESTFSFSLSVSETILGRQWLCFGMCQGESVLSTRQHLTILNNDIGVCIKLILPSSLASTMGHSSKGGRRRKEEEERKLAKRV